MHFSFSFTAIALLTPLHKDECMSSLVCSTLSTLLWLLPGLAATDAIIHLLLWYLINRCRAKTDTLPRKLAEGSLELKDKSRLSGRFSWRLIAYIRLDDNVQGSQEGGQQDTSNV
jgi:hypothetical protein